MNTNNKGTNQRWNKQECQGNSSLNSLPTFFPKLSTHGLCCVISEQWSCLLSAQQPCMAVLYKNESNFIIIISSSSISCCGLACGGTVLSVLVPCITSWMSVWIARSLVWGEMQGSLSQRAYTGRADILTLPLGPCRVESFVKLCHSILMIDYTLRAWSRAAPPPLQPGSRPEPWVSVLSLSSKLFGCTLLPAASCYHILCMLNIRRMCLWGVCCLCMEQGLILTLDLVLVCVVGDPFFAVLLTSLMWNVLVLLLQSWVMLAKLVYSLPPLQRKGSH